MNRIKYVLPEYKDPSHNVITLQICTCSSTADISEQGDAEGCSHATSLDLSKKEIKDERKQLPLSNLTEKFDVKARYWLLLFKNLELAISEIFQACAYNEHFIENKDTISVLENCCSDLQDLLNWIRLKKTQENVPLPINRSSHKVQTDKLDSSLTANVSVKSISNESKSAVDNNTEKAQSERISESWADQIDCDEEQKANSGTSVALTDCIKTAVKCINNRAKSPTNFKVKVIPVAVTANEQTNVCETLKKTGKESPLKKDNCDHVNENSPSSQYSQQLKEETLKEQPAPTTKVEYHDTSSQTDELSPTAASTATSSSTASSTATSVSSTATSASSIATSVSSTATSASSTATSASSTATSALSTAPSASSTAPSPSSTATSPSSTATSASSTATSASSTAVTTIATTTKRYPLPVRKSASLPQKKPSLKPFLVPLVPDRNAPIPTFSSPLIKQNNRTAISATSAITSPRKPVPGRNVAAPVFVPGRKHALSQNSNSNSPRTEATNRAAAACTATTAIASTDSAVVDTVVPVKSVLPRSQSSSVIETNIQKKNTLALSSNLKRLPEKQSLSNDSLNSRVGTAIKYEQQFPLVKSSTSDSVLIASSDSGNATNTMNTICELCVNNGILIPSSAMYLCNVPACHRAGSAVRSAATTPCNTSMCHISSASVENVVYYAVKPFSEFRSKSALDKSSSLEISEKNVNPAVSGAATKTTQTNINSVTSNGLITAKDDKKSSSDVSLNAESIGSVVEKHVNNSSSDGVKKSIIVDEPKSPTKKISFTADPSVVKSVTSSVSKAPTIVGSVIKVQNAVKQPVVVPSNLHSNRVQQQRWNKRQQLDSPDEKKGKISSRMTVFKRATAPTTARTKQQRLQDEFKCSTGGSEKVNTDTKNISPPPAKSNVNVNNCLTKETSNSVRPEETITTTTSDSDKSICLNSKLNESNCTNVGTVKSDDFKLSEKTGLISKNNQVTVIRDQSAKREANKSGPDNGPVDKNEADQYSPDDTVIMNRMNKEPDNEHTPNGNVDKKPDNEKKEVACLQRDKDNKINDSSTDRDKINKSRYELRINDAANATIKNRMIEDKINSVVGQTAVANAVVENKTAGDKVNGVGNETTVVANGTNENGEIISFLPDNRMNQINYSNAIKKFTCDNSKTAVASKKSYTVLKQENFSSPKLGRSNFSDNRMVRSKTSIDMKPPSASYPYRKENTPSPVSKSSKIVDPAINGVGTIMNRSGRKTSVDEDGWEVVLSRSRRSIPISSNAGSSDNDSNNGIVKSCNNNNNNNNNSNNRYNGNFQINKRFYVPTPSSSLPTLSYNLTEKKSKEFKRKEFRAKAESKLSFSSDDSSNSSVINHRYQQPQQQQQLQQQLQRNNKLNKERPIISNTAMFTTVDVKLANSKEQQRQKYCSGRKRHATKATGLGGNGRDTTEQVCKNLCAMYEKELFDMAVKDDQINEYASRKSRELFEKEQELEKEINNLENMEIDVDTETDELESNETDTELNHFQIEEGGLSQFAKKRLQLIRKKCDHILSELSEAEQARIMNKFEEIMDMDPTGRSFNYVTRLTTVKQLDDFLSKYPTPSADQSPNRKRYSPDTTIIQHNARQAKAKKNRDHFLREKSAKLREILNKVDVIKLMEQQLKEDRRKVLEQKLKKAEENRNLHIRNIQEKAHNEAKKLKEIAFINELEAQNKRHDFYTSCQEQEDRLQGIMEERQRKQEEKAAKEAAAEERRKAIEVTRQERIKELQKRMRKREERVDRELQQKELERIKAAREKARDREDRIHALHAAQLANVEELQKKIQQKQEESARRHEENIEQIRQRAVEFGSLKTDDAPRFIPYKREKLCTLCNVLIDSEILLFSHLKGKSHQDAVKLYREKNGLTKFVESSVLTEAPEEVLNEKRMKEKERHKSLRKRCKKIRHKLSVRSEEYIKTYNEKKKLTKIDGERNKIHRYLKDAEKILSTHGFSIWPNNAITNLEKDLWDISKSLEKHTEVNQNLFKDVDGFKVLAKVYDLALDIPKNVSPYLPTKCFLTASSVFINACNNNVSNCIHVILSNRLVQLLDLLLKRIILVTTTKEIDDYSFTEILTKRDDSIADAVMNIVITIFQNIISAKDTHADVMNNSMLADHMHDLLSYTVCTGVVDKLAVYCSSIRDNQFVEFRFLLRCIQLLNILTETKYFNDKKTEDTTQFTSTLQTTELVGSVSMLYGILLHQDSMSTGDGEPLDDLKSDVMQIVITTLKWLCKVAEFNLKLFQSVLGAEGISLQVRHITSYILRYCGQHGHYKPLMHPLIELIGFFAIHHHDNQMILQSGSTPTVIHQLTTSLPFGYFSDDSLRRVLFPTLLACSIDNEEIKTILEQDVSLQLLEEFRKSPSSKDIPLVKLL